MLVLGDSEGGKAKEGMKEAVITSLGCKVDCSAQNCPMVLIRHTGTSLQRPPGPYGPTWASPSLPFPPAILCLLLPQTPRHGPSPGLVPCPSPHIHRAHYLISFRSLPKCLLSEASPDLFEIVPPTPTDSTAYLPAMVLGSTSHHQMPYITH